MTLTHCTTMVDRYANIFSYFTLYPHSAEIQICLVFIMQRKVGAKKAYIMCLFQISDSSDKA